MFCPARSDRLDLPSMPMAIVVVIETLPLLLLVVVLSPALLIGPLLPGRQEFTLRLLAAMQRWNCRRLASGKRPK